MDANVAQLHTGVGHRVHWVNFKFQSAGVSTTVADNQSRQNPIRISRAKRTSDSDSATSKTSEKQHLKFFPREMGIQIFGRFQPGLYMSYFGVSCETKGVSGYKNLVELLCIGELKLMSIR
jgi:hypothetical protein